MSRNTNHVTKQHTTYRQTDDSFNSKKRKNTAFLPSTGVVCWLSRSFTTTTITTTTTSPTKERVVQRLTDLKLCSDKHTQHIPSSARFDTRTQHNTQLTVHSPPFSWERRKSQPNKTENPSVTSRHTRKFALSSLLSCLLFLFQSLSSFFALSSHVQLRLWLWLW